MNPENNTTPNFNSANIGASPVPPTTPPTPAAPVSPAANPAAEAAANPAPEATPANPTEPVPGMATLGVPVVSPTHFDNQNLANPVVPTPGNPGINAPGTSPVPPADSTRLAAPAVANAEQTIKKFTTMSIIFGAAAAVMFILAIIGMVVGISNGSKLGSVEADLNNKKAIVTAVEETTGVSPIDSPDQVPVWKTTQGYIYITEWGIKLKIPDDLTSVSYILDQKYRPSICFNAVKAGVQYFPAFADVAKNPGGMGCLTKVAVNEGNNDAATGLSFGTQVFTYKEFNYFYTAPAKVYSEDAAERGLESTAVQIIKNMITDNISQYE